MPARPNFAFIFPDQWRGDCLGSLGHPVVETPFLDEIAASGVTFTAAFSPSPSCIAARASLITGQTPSTTGRLGYRDRVPWRYEHTLMRCLRDAGYQTLLTGKTHFYPQRASLGFEEMRLYDTQKHEPGYVSDYEAWLEIVADGQIRDTAKEISTNSWLACPWTMPERFHPNTWTMDASIDLLQRRDPTRPFFIQIGFHRPHPPLDPPQRYYERFEAIDLPPAPVGDWASRYDQPPETVNASSGHLPEKVLARTRRAYYAQLAHIDYQVGRLINWLQQNSLHDDTIIVFSSDHGELLGDHHLFRKTNPFEGSARIPLIIRVPGSGFTGTRQQPVSIIDFMPTFLDIAGVDIPGTVEGRSLLPLLQDSETPWRDFVHGEHAPGWQYVTDGRQKYIWESTSGRQWFFDLVSDPQETANLIDISDHNEGISFWRRRLIDVLAQRPDDGLTDGEGLIAGARLPSVRPELLS